MNNLRRELEGLRRMAEERRKEGTTYLDYPPGIERHAYQIWQVLLLHRQDPSYGEIDDTRPLPTYEGVLELLKNSRTEDGYQ